jgi:hypothetical protein
VNGKYYVIAGTRPEFNEFIQRKALELFGKGEDISLSNFVFVNASDQLRGIECPHGWFIGSWRDRSNIHEILQQLLVRYIGEPIPENLKKIYNEILPSNSNP